jgi:hypothetical protein
MSVRLLLTGLAGAALAGLLTGCNSAPTVVADSAVATPGTPVTVDVLANDSDPDADPLIVKRAWGATRGDVVINPDNTITYTPYTGESGNDEFMYRVRDNHGHAKNGKVVVAINNAPPRAIVVAPPPQPQQTTVVVTPPPTVSTPPPTIHATPEPRKPDVTPITPPPPPPGTPMIQSIRVILHTTDDDKNREDAVRVVLRKDQETVAERTFGVGELWGSNSDRAFEITLKPEVPLTDAGALTLDIHKPPAGGATGGGWAMQVQVDGQTSDGKTITLLPQTQPVKLGDGEPNDRSWAIPGVK